MTVRLVAACLFFAASVRAEPLVWQSDHQQALADAQKAKKPVLLNFSAPWCTYCRLMDGTTFEDPTVLGALAQYVTVKIDYDTSPELVANHRVGGIPAFVLLNQFGEKAAETSGYQDARKFYDWLTRSRKLSFAKVSRRAAEEEKLKALGADLRNADSAVRERGVERLLEAYIAAEQRDLAAAELRRLIAENPKSMAPRLNDPRLAIRILVANQFAEKYGEGFAFDPWAGEEARRAAVAAWMRRDGGE